MKNRTGLFAVYLIVFLLVVLLKAELGMAYDWAWTSIQHRVYENGNAQNRLSIMIKKKIRRIG